MRDTSEYVIAGRRVPSVTEILSLAGLTNWGMVPSSVLELAAQRGRETHLWLELVDRGYLSPEDEPPPQIQGYVSAYYRFRAETDFEPDPDGIEETVLNLSHFYAGTLDRRGRLNRDRVVIDFKTGVPTPAAHLQTAGYAACLEGRFKRFALHLRPEGTYRLEPHASRNDLPDFLAAVRVAHLRLSLNLGGIPE